MPRLLRQLHAIDDPAEADATLVAHAQCDPDAFAAIYDRYFDPVYRYCYHRLGSREAAEDATSQVFLKVLAALPHYREGGTFRSWLFTIAHHQVVNRHRERRPDWPLDAANEHPDPMPLPDDLAEAADERPALAAAVAKLPPDQRRVIELRLAGLTGPEIAHLLNRSHAAVKMLQLRAVERLRDLLDVSAMNMEAHDA
jgi:RNA polymerase sigma-70 factor (ECF subfamily)